MLREHNRWRQWVPSDWRNLGPLKLLNRSLSPYRRGEYSEKNDENSVRKWPAAVKYFGSIKSSFMTFGQIIFGYIEIKIPRVLSFSFKQILGSFWVQGRGGYTPMILDNLWITLAPRCSNYCLAMIGPKHETSVSADWSSNWSFHERW